MVFKPKRDKSDRKLIGVVFKPNEEIKVVFKPRGNKIVMFKPNR